MGRVAGGDHVTPLGCRVRVLNVERDDGNDVMLSLSMEGEHDDRHVEVLLDNGSRWALINMLTRADERAWPNMGTHQLLAAAQEASAFTHSPEKVALAGHLLAAAQVQATENLTWTMEHRVAASMGRSA